MVGLHQPVIQLAGFLDDELHLVIGDGNESPDDFSEDYRPLLALGLDVPVRDPQLDRHIRLSVVEV